MQGRGRGRAGVGLQPAVRAVPRTHGHDSGLTQRLQQLATDLDAAGNPLQQFLEMWAVRFGVALRAADYGEFALEDVITR